MTTKDLENLRSSALSALVDGELPSDRVVEALGDPSAAGDAQAQWGCYHLIGDALRGSDLVSRGDSRHFVQRLMQSIEAEEMAPYLSGPLGITIFPVSHRDTSPVAANDAKRWKYVAGFASLMAVAIVGWSTWGAAGGGNGLQDAIAMSSPLTGSNSMIRTPNDALLAAGSDPVQPMLRNAELDQYLAEHGQAAGGSALQPASVFVRNAIYVAPVDAP